jgi:hypothetical protein
MIKKKNIFRELITLVGLLSIFYFLLPASFPSTNLFYVSVIFFSIYFAALSEIQSRAIPRKIYFACSFLVLFFALAFRDLSGIDDLAYSQIFHEVRAEGVWSRFISSYMEPGFLFLQYLIGIFTSNYHVAQVVNTLIPMVFFYAAFRKYRAFLSFPLAVALFIALLYFQMLSVSLVRMFIAISIVFYSIDCLWKQQFRKYCCWIFLAASLHYSALIMLLFSPLVFNRVLKHWKMILLASAILLPLLFIIIAGFASQIGGRYESYGEINNFTFSLDALNVLPFALIAWFYRKNIPNEYRTLFLLSGILLLFSCLIELYSSMISLGRCVFYMNQGMILALPTAYKFSRGLSKWIIATIIFIYMLLYLLIAQFFLLAHGEHLFPYKNFFFRL